MKSILSIFVSLMFLSKLEAQENQFGKYGPFSAEVYKDLKVALKVSDAVYKLDLSYQAIEPKLFSKIGKLKNLQALQLSSNSISVWPSDFKNLTNLVYFSSINNNFTSFPPELKQLGNLMYLEFFGCKLDSIPDEIAYLNRLKVLRIGNIEDTLKLSNKLKWVSSITELSIETVPLDSCPKQLFRIQTLKQLTITNCKMQAMPHNLDNASNLEVLIVDGNNLTAIPRTIYKCKKIKTLSLKNNKITKIPDTICHLTNLLYLDLRGNIISKEDIEELKALLPGCKILN